LTTTKLETATALTSENHDLVNSIRETVRDGGKKIRDRYRLSLEKSSELKNTKQRSSSKQINEP
jgi:hypothetical protein